MCAAADFDVAFDGRSGKGIEQPTRVVVRHQPIPFAADDCDRTADSTGVIAEPAMPGLDDIAERAKRRLHACRRTCTALGIAVEVALAPFVEVLA
jgi:hypothetical protein